MKPYIPDNMRAPGGGPLLAGKSVIESGDGKFLGVAPTVVIPELLETIPGSESFVVVPVVIGERYSKPVPAPLDPWTASLKAGV